VDEYLRNLKRLRGRPLHLKIIDAVFKAETAHCPALYLDRNGAGKAYYTLVFYERPDPTGLLVRRKIYLGDVEDAAVERIRQSLRSNAAEREAKKAEARRLRDMSERIRLIRAMIASAQRLAASAASSCGYWFKGHELRRRRTT